MTTVMAPTDGSAMSDNAVAVAGRLAQAQGADVLLVRVLQPIALEADSFDTSLDPDIYEQVLKTIEAQTESEVAKLRDGLIAQGIKARAVTPRGFVAGALLDIEAAEHADLVVMATHGRTGVARFALGSIADRIVREGEVPVLLVRPSTPSDVQLRSALVLLDGSGVAEYALPWVERLAGKPLERVTLFRAVASAEDRSPAKTYLDAIGSRIAHAGCRINTVVEVGDPLPTVDRAAREHDLVILSTHGRGGFERLRHGSVAEAIVREISNPVLLVRVPPE